jgi:7-cyano-7-deazaguanine synthase in queuosine biosynthesis
MTSVFVRRGGNETGGCQVLLDSSKNLLTGEQRFQKEFGSITTLEADLLLLAASIYAVDRCSKRGDREECPRDLEVNVPVINAGVLQPLVSQIELVLRKLSSDSWQIHVRQEAGTPEKQTKAKSEPGKTLLFSGGLDSLAAAIEFGKPIPDLHLVSHVTHNQATASAQKQLVSLLGKKLKMSLPHHRFFVSAKSGPPADTLRFDLESSQRTRSFLFLALGALCARRVGHNEVLVIAENGQMAIHLPITQGRLGPYSTRTAHPEILEMMGELLNTVLGTKLKFVNPYVNETKGEVVRRIYKKLPDSIPVSTSCWKNARLSQAAAHCGACIPCIIRRIAIESCGTDHTAYARDLFSDTFANLSPEDDGRRNLADYSEFIMRIENTDRSEVTVEWPELLTPPVVASKAIEMYKRAAKEARKVFSKYPGLKPLLQ